ncbi:Muscle M-line assembly protein unc-89, partial [Stegodyphus mimosarum]
MLLEAKVTGNPKPTVVWDRNGTKLESGDHIKLSEGDNKAILSIEAAKAEDAGEYKLTATNEEGEDNSSAIIKVSVPGKKPAIVKELKAAKLLEGEEGKLELVVSGYPMPEVAWMHNGKNVLEGQHCTTSIDEKGLATLTIHNVKCEDAGMYT